MRLRRPLTAMAFAALLAAGAPSWARTKLVTLPERATLIVNLENPAMSLLAEEREITLQRGTNFVDFAWQGVSIDRGSIRLEPLSNPGEGENATKIINVAFPPDGVSLTWQIYSPEARTERIRVSYLLHGISRDFSYEMIVNPEETAAVFKQYFHVSNQSGEDLDDAELRIAQAGNWTRSVDSGEVRRFLALTQEGLPVRKIYITHPEPSSTGREEGETISMVYEIANTTASGLGRFQLDGGKTRLFGLAPDGTSIFLGEDMLQSTAVGEESDLTLGVVKDVVLKRHIMADRRENERRNRDNRIVMYDRVVTLRYEIENFKDKPATLRVMETLPEDARIVSIPEGVTSERKSGSELELNIALEARPADGTVDVPVREVLITYRVDNVIN